MKLRRVLCILLLVLTLTGCMKAVPLDEYAYVIALGVDKGIVNKYNMSFLLQKEGGGENGQENAGAKVMSSEGDTLNEAIQSLQLAYPNALNLSRLIMVAVSDEMARKGLIEEGLAIAFNSYHMRRSIKLITVQGSVQEYFNGMSLESEPNVTKLHVAMMNAKYEDGIAPIMNIALFTETVRGKRLDAVMPLGIASKPSEQTGKDDSDKKEKITAQGRSGAMKSYICGAAVFRGGDMVGTIAENDICFLLLGRGELDECNLDVLVAGDKVSLRLFTISNKAQARIVNGQPCVKLTANIRCELLLCPKRSLNADEIANEVKTFLIDGLNRVFNAGKELNSDVYGFGRYVSMCFSKVDEWEEYNWKSKLSACRAEYEINVEINDKTLVWEVSG